MKYGPNIWKIYYISRAYKLSSTCGLCNEVILYRSGLCNKVVIKYTLVTHRKARFHFNCIIRIWQPFWRVMRLHYVKILCAYKKSMQSHSIGLWQWILELFLPMENNKVDKGYCWPITKRQVHTGQVNDATPNKKLKSSDEEDATNDEMDNPEENELVTILKRQQRSWKWPLTVNWITTWGKWRPRFKVYPTPDGLNVPRLIWWCLRTSY